MYSPLFFSPSPSSGELSEAEAYHIAKALRGRPGMELFVTDGKGSCIKAVLTGVTPKKATFEPQETLSVYKRPYRVRIAVAPTRKPERNEWMLEKLVELGVDEISFIKTTNTHLESFFRVVNRDRMEKIAVSAMKQSGQFALPEIKIGADISELIALPGNGDLFIAYVPEQNTAPVLHKAATESTDALVLIGPEGDFTPEEVVAATSAGFQPVSLGPTRLRTETAAIAACLAIHLAR